MACMSSLLNFSASSFPICASSSNSSRFPLSQKPKRHDACKVECNGNENNMNPRNRRDILIGLGGLYGASSLSTNHSGSAFGAPLSPPDPTNCIPATVPHPGESNCCPPPLFTDYELPPYDPTQVRIRKAAHLLDDEFVAKYKEALSRMKALPDDDPRSFMQQANVHCAYCAGSYKQKGFPDKILDVHESWLFFPFHRWYLYFYERILGSLINDPTFALPFWNWDHPNGMRMPSIYTQNQNSPLHDFLRDPRHIGAFMDLNYDPKKETDKSHVNPTIKQINSNLATLFKGIVEKTDQTEFLGAAYFAGCPPNAAFGSLETIHNTVHIWTGQSKDTNPETNGENMGILYAAARDPIFFAHHSNVDRMWNIWTSELPGGKRSNFNHEDWLESSFFFYDENKNYVRVKVKDCLDSARMGYDYERVDLPWLNGGRLIKRKGLSGLAPKQKALKVLKTLPTLELPLTLDSILRKTVNRPPLGSRKVEEKEVLVIEVEYDKSEGVRFDVFINDQDDDDIGPLDSEFAGSFVTLPHHSHKQTMMSSSSFRCTITNLLKDLEAEDDDSIVVTVAPKYGRNPVTVKDIRIELAPRVK